MKRAVFRPVAKEEVDEAFGWYEARERGLGRRFLRALDKTISAIETFPKMFQYVTSDFRQALIKNFPYSVLYIEEEERIVILAVFHLSRDPVIREERF